MDFDYSPRTKELQAKLLAFFDAHIYPNEKAYHDEIEANTAAGKRWTPLQTIEKLKPIAQKAGLWNLWLPRDTAEIAGFGGDPLFGGAGLTNQEYAPLAEVMGRVPWSGEVFNCSAPDTGNMETIARYGSPALRERWLKPLLRGEIRSAFAMTEPDVASSDATNIATRVIREGNEYVINGRKWWISGAGDPRCAVYITMGKSDPDAPRHSQQSMIIIPADTPGIKVVRPLTVFGYDDAPHGHCEMTFTNVRVPAENMLLGEGRGFEIAQGRLGPGRIHHCMRLVGLAERCLELMCKRASSRVAFGKTVAVANRYPRAHCRGPLPHRHGAPAHPQNGLADGRGWQQAGQKRYRHDQGGRPQHGLPGSRLGHASPRRWRYVRRFPAGLCLHSSPHPALCRRPRRSAPQRHCQAGAGQVCAGKT